MLRSRKTQEWQNYVDLSESRVRHSKTGFTPAVFNAFALSLEEAEDAVRREAGTLTPEGCPLRHDNRGIWHQVYLPAGLEIFLPENVSIQGLKNGVWHTLRPAGRGPEIPDRLSVDSASIGWIPVWKSSGAVRFPAGPVPFPFRPVIEPSRPGAGPSSVFLQGVYYPWCPWDSGWSREVFCSPDGYGFGREILSEISDAYSANLAEATVYPGTALMERTPDPEFPYVDSMDRGRRWPAFWSAKDGKVLLEFFRFPAVGFETARRDALPEPAVSICPEPRSSFLVAASESSLYWLDKREILPGSIRKTAPSAAPPFLLELSSHPDYAEDPSWLRLTVSGPGSRRWRLSVEFPDGNRYILASPYGSLLEPYPYRLTDGWQASPPRPEYSFRLPEDGDYVFYLESQTEAGMVADAVAWRRGRLQIYRSFLMEDQVSEIKAVWFDALERLWIWTGTHLIRILEEYDVYAVSPDGRKLYVSCPYERIRIER